MPNRDADPISQMARSWMSKTHLAVYPLCHYGSALQATSTCGTLQVFTRILSKNRSHNGLFG